MWKPPIDTVTLTVEGLRGTKLNRKEIYELELLKRAQQIIR